MSLFRRFGRTVVLIAALVVAMLSPAGLRAQTPRPAAAQVPVVDASNLLQPTSFDAGWLAEAGDNPAWADPNYDDSHWHRFNARTDSLHTLFPKQRPDVVWYRLHLKVAPHDTAFVIEEWYLGSAFEIYANGVQVLRVGSVKPYSPYDYNAHLLVAIPRGQIASGNVVLAVRMHFSATEWMSTGPGLYYNNLVFGQQQTLQEHIWLQVIGSNALLELEGLLILAFAIAVALLYSAQRRREYLILTLALLAAIMATPVELYGAFHTFPEWWHVLDSVGTFFNLYLWALAYLALIGRPAGWRLHAFLLFASAASSVQVTLAWMNIATPAIQIAGYLPFIALFSVVLPIILIRAMRRGNRDAGILLVPMLLTICVQILSLVLFGLGQIPVLRAAVARVSASLAITAGPFAIPLDVVAGILSVLSMALIVLLRSNRQSRQQAVLESEMVSAHQVQQVLLPDAAESVPGFRVDSVYAPAQEVGGDFFQTIPDGAGGLIVVVGDVSGKGLPAAMLVSVLVGAIRSVAEFTSAPAAILEHLNRRLIGRTSGGFSTAVAVHIDAKGAVAIANAGHLAPYLDGRELELPGALPLGIDPDTTYEEQTFALNPQGRLVFYSDGVVEAQNAKGELLGFPRAAELSTGQVADIAAEAKHFGQLDDITVIAIVWEGARLARQQPLAAGVVPERSLNLTSHDKYLQAPELAEAATRSSHPYRQPARRDEWVPTAHGTAQTGWPILSRGERWGIAR